MPDQQAWETDALNINWSGIIAYAYPPTTYSPSQADPKNPSMKLSHYPDSSSLDRDALVLEPSAAFNRNPIPVTGINNNPQAVSQTGVSQQSTIPQPACLASRSEQLQERGFSVKEADRIACLTAKR